MNARDDARFEVASNSADAEARFVELVEQIKRENRSQVEIYCRFENRLALALSNPDRRSYDALADTMELIIGWCGPHSRLFSHYLSNKKIAQ